MKRLGALNHAVALSRATRRSKPAREEIGGAECREQFPPRPKAKCFLLTFLFIGRPISHPSFDQSKCQRFKVPVVLQLFASVASQGGNSMARKVAKSSHEATARWLIRVYLGRDRETQKRKYHNRTIHGPMREAQAYLTRKLRERDLGRDLEGAKITLNEYLDRWIQTAVKPRVR